MMRKTKFRAQQLAALETIQKRRQEKEIEGIIGEPIKTARAIIYMSGGCMVNPPAQCPHKTKYEGYTLVDISVCNYCCDDQCAKYEFLHNALIERRKKK